MPTTGMTTWEGIRKNFVSDFSAALYVSLLALPLCLAIAQGSGFPPIAGLIAAIVGGLVVPAFRGSNLGINGPAAALMVIVLAGVKSMGEGDAQLGYERTLAAIAFAGVLIVLMGYLKFDRIAEFIPTAVIEGLMAAIGTIILIKQFHPLVGVSEDTNSVLESALHIPHSLQTMEPHAALIGGISVAVLVFMNSLKRFVPFLKKVPIPFVILILAIPLEMAYHLPAEPYLVNLPSDPIHGIVLPDFSAFMTLDFHFTALSIAVIVFLETLMLALAIDKLDPFRRMSNLRKETLGVGSANALSGAIGGLPLITEIVRGAANAQNGARTRLSNTYHALLLLVFLFLLKDIIQMVPVAALAAMLVVTGFRLAHPKFFIQAWRTDRWHFAVVVGTFLAIVLINVLYGILLGIALALVVAVLRGAQPKDIVRAKTRSEASGHNQMTVFVQGKLLFSNYMSLKKQLHNIPANTEVILHLREAELVDHSAGSNLIRLARHPEMANIPHLHIHWDDWRPEA